MSTLTCNLVLFQHDMAGKDGIEIPRLIDSVHRLLGQLMALPVVLQTQG